MAIIEAIVRYVWGMATGEMMYLLFSYKHLLLNGDMSLISNEVNRIKRRVVVLDASKAIE